MQTEVLPVTPATLPAILMRQAPALRRHIEHWIPRRLRRTIATDDVLQEVWIAAYRTVATFVPDGPRATEKWLTRIARAKVTDALRTARRLKRRTDWRCIHDTRFSSLADFFSQLEGSQTTPSREAHAAQVAQLTMTALAGLSDLRRTVAEMYYVQGLSHKEIAQRTGRTEDAVNNLLFSVRQELRSTLGSASKYFSDARSASADPVAQGAGQTVVDQRGESGRAQE